MKITNEDNMKLMARYEDNYFDLAIVDVPYGIKQGGENNESRGKLTKARKYKSFDDSTAPDKTYFNELKRVSKNQIIWGANHFIENLPEANSPNWIVWDKVNGATDYADAELAYTSFGTAVRIFKYMWMGMHQGSMGGDVRLNEVRIHPTQKPVVLYEWLLDNYAKWEHLGSTSRFKILDTHLGSGSIAIACHNRGFDLTACELDKDYYDAAMKRIKQHKAQLTMF